LEEVTPTFATEHLPKLANLYPYQAVQRDSTRPGDTYVLSRYPIVSAETVALGIAGFPEPQRVVIDVDGQHIAIYAVHMAWPLADDAIEASGLNYYVQLMLAFDDRVRNQQIDKLITHLKHEPLPYIVAGDFNMSDFSATYGKLAAVMHDSFIEGGQGLGGSWPVTTHNNMPKWLPPLIRIDYIWHSDGLRTIRAWQGEETGSDHLPLLADLALES
jgi:endonuclease/exonuclease/phosphatase family metal-dependent hydrolase